MKKLLPVIALAAILLTACGEPKEENESQSETTAPVTDAVSEELTDSLTEDSASDSSVKNEKAKETEPVSTKASKQKDSAADSVSGNALPVIGEDGAEQVIPADSASDSVPEFSFDDEGAIELPIIPIN